MIRSLRVRLMLAATTLAILFMLALLPAMQGAFSLALQDAIEQRLASDVTTLISAARVDSNEFAKIREDNGNEFFVYDVEVKLLGGKSAAYSFVALQPMREYKMTLAGLREKLYLGFGAALSVLLLLLWIGLTWGLRALRRLSQELDAIESGDLQSLSEDALPISCKVSAKNTRASCCA